MTGAEEWRPVDGYQGLYEVSSRGRIISKQPRWKTPRILKLAIKRRYMTVAITLNGTTKHRLVHRLVMASFVGRCPVGYEVNHKDGNTLNNSVDNLEYITKADNYKHATTNQLYERGEDRHTAKLSESDVAEIRAQRGKETGRSLAKRFDVTPSCISVIQLRKGWKHVS